MVTKGFLHREVAWNSIRLNTVLMFIFRGGNILCGLIMVPITLGYLDKTNYGAWLTLSSVISWLSFMDIGLGNGLRNKLAEAIAQKNNKLAREYVSTTYVLFSIIMLVLLVVFSVVNPFLNWQNILKIDINNSSLILLTYVVFFSFCLRLILELGSIIIVSLQRPFIKIMIDFFVSVVTLIGVYSLTKITNPSLISFGIAICIIPILILLVFTYYLFNKRSKYSYLAPSFRHYKKKHINDLLNLGVQFFIIQLAVLVMFSTDNIIITQLFSAADVSSFNIAYKYFSIMIIAFSIIVFPYWSAFTTAFIKKDLLWIKGAFKKLIIIWILQVFIVLGLIICANFVYKVWVGDEIEIPVGLNVFLGVYVILYNFNNIFAYFLNGVSKIRLQLYSAVFVGIVNIPLSYLLVKHTNMGITAIALSNCICLLVCSLWAPLQCYKIINNTASGIWNK